MHDSLDLLAIRTVMVGTGTSGGSSRKKDHFNGVLWQEIQVYSL